jgi:valyl-tRNA synthetase
MIKGKGLKNKNTMDIPSKYNPKDIESGTLSKWLDSNCFHAEPQSAKAPYAIAIPPPNITGILHMGHALNNTIQDVLVRYNRMNGKESLWMPGTDHAGIATQNVVEKQLAKEGLRKEDLGREEFEKRLWAWRDEYGSTIINQLKKIGASCDWQRMRFTMDPQYSDAVKEVFIRLFNKGLIYRGNYIINWCPRCKTALSDEEAAHKEIDGWLYHIKYPVIKTKETDSSAPDYIVVATTRPETMLGDTAIAVNPADERYEWLKKARVILPVVERELKIIEDEAIDPSFGTGAVKVTPAHDPVDFILGKKYDLEFINIMNADATLNENVPDSFINMDRFEARQALLVLLEEKKLIEKKETYKVNAGHCYRCNTIIEPRISLQWFVKMKPLAENAIKVVETGKINFYPGRWKKVYLNWMNNIQDWCISRQIWWGHRLPVYYCNDCKNQADESTDSNFGVIVSKVKPDKCPKCLGVNITQDEDVLDTWFSSWLWPFATLGWPKETKELKFFYPTDALVTASEILFFWVARMIMAGLEFIGEIPFKDVLIHGTVRDEKGIKMSKSLGNTIDPLEIIDKYGADALRFSLMLSAASGSDVYLGEDRFLVGRNFCNKIWNATRFIFLKITENDIKIDGGKFGSLDATDTWVLKELDETIKEVSRYIENYSLNEATKKIYDFFWHTFCDWYIEIVKDDVTPQKAKVLIVVLRDSMKLLHPIMPYISEEIARLINDLAFKSKEKENILASADWPKVYNFKSKLLEEKVIEELTETIKSIRTIKNDLGLGQKKISIELNFKEKKYEDLWQENKTWILRLAGLSDISYKDKLDRALSKSNNWSLNFSIDTQDMSAFFSTLDKKIKSLCTAVNKVSARLSNTKFIENADPKIVEHEKNKHTDMNLELKRLKELKNAFS